MIFIDSLDFIKKCTPFSEQMLLNRILRTEASLLEFSTGSTRSSRNAVIKVWPYSGFDTSRGPGCQLNTNSLKHEIFCEQRERAKLQ